MRCVICDVEVDAATATLCPQPDCESVCCSNPEEDCLTQHLDMDHDIRADKVN